MKTIECPCCGNITLEQKGYFEICDICGWEDDNLQRAKPDFPGGANPISLNEARAAFSKGKNLTKIFALEQNKYFLQVERARKIAESRGEKFLEGEADKWLALENYEQNMVPKGQKSKKLQPLMAV